MRSFRLGGHWQDGIRYYYKDGPPRYPDQLRGPWYNDSAIRQEWRGLARVGKPYRPCNFDKSLAAAAEEDLEGIDCPDSESKLEMRIRARQGMSNLRV